MSPVVIPCATEQVPVARYPCSVSSPLSASSSATFISVAAIEDMAIVCERESPTAKSEASLKVSFLPFYGIFEVK